MKKENLVILQHLPLWKIVFVEKERKGIKTMLTINFERLDTRGKDSMWFALQTILPAVLRVMCDTPTEQGFVNYIRVKTLDFKKLKEKLNVGELLEYILVAPKKAYEVKAKLLKKNILIDLGNGFYCLNISEIIALYKDLFACYYTANGQKKIDILYSRAKNILGGECGNIIYAMCFNKERKVELSEKLKENDVKRREKAKIRRQKVLANDITHAKEIQPFLAEICRDFEVKFYREDWTQKQWGQARNWIKACIQGGKSPRNVLTEVCKHWLELNNYVRDKLGNEVLTNIMSFSTFYKFRNDIGRELLQEREQKVYNVTVHNL